MIFTLQIMKNEKTTLFDISRQRVHENHKCKTLKNDNAVLTYLRLFLVFIAFSKGILKTLNLCINKNVELKKVSLFPI